VALVNARLKRQTLLAPATFVPSCPQARGEQSLCSRTGCGHDAARLGPSFVLFSWLSHHDLWCTELPKILLAKSTARKDGRDTSYRDRLVCSPCF
jgi:hypothetical protein